MRKGERKYNIPPKEKLRELYWDREVSMNDIGEMFGIPGASIRHMFYHLGIPVRTSQEAAFLVTKQGKRPESMTPKKEILTCKRCFFVWRNTSKLQSVPCPICGLLLDARYRAWSGSGEQVARLRKWRKSTNTPVRQTESRNRLRRRVLAVVARGGSIVCASCGCNDIKLLEVNHVNGGGNREYQHGLRSMKFYYSIVKLERSVEDLNLLCKVCNARHALELRYGKQPYQIIWEGNSKDE